MFVFVCVSMSRKEGIERKERIQELGNMDRDGDFFLL